MCTLHSTVQLYILFRTGVEYVSVYNSLYCTVVHLGLSIVRMVAVFIIVNNKNILTTNALVRYL